MANTPDILTRMNRAIDYIEEHLTNEIDLETAARLACTSAFNFQRMFSFMTDVTLTEYIRRGGCHWRLSCCAAQTAV